MADSASPDFKYWAFISYSSKDVACAKRLHKALESYRIPRDLRGRPGRDGPVPEKLFPVFRDRDELPLSSDLGSSIQDALRACRYLIVICSPNSAASRWVNEEIRYFKSLGREDRILALILDGEPGAGDQGRPELESFPEALRFEVEEDGTISGRPCEPIGGDLRKGGDGWKVSFLKAVAGITGLGFDSFARREARRARRKRLLQGALALVVLFGGLFAWDHYRIKTDYYHALSFVYGEPLGVGELSEAEAARRYRTFRFRHSQGKVREVAVVSASGKLRSLDTPGLEYPAFATLEVDYREDGQVASHAYANAAGDGFLRLDFSEDLRTIDRILPTRTGGIASGGGGLAIGSSGWAAAETGNPAGSSSSVISRYLVDYDERGRVVAMHYRNAWGSPVNDEDGAFSLRLERGDSGLVSRVTSVAQDGRPVAAKSSGAASKVFKYDDKLRLVEERYLDAAGRPVRLLTSGFSILRTEFDELGNVTMREFFDENDEPCLRFNSHHRVVAEYNERGDLLRQFYYLADGSPGKDRTGGAPQVRYYFDEADREIAYENCDMQGRLIETQGGVAIRRNGFDPAGRLIEVRVFGADEAPVVDPVSGCHETRWEFHETGRILAKEHYDTARKPTYGPGGYFREQNELNPAGFVIKTSYFGPDGKPCLKTSTAAHIERFIYDQRGNIRSESYFGIGDQKINQPSGYHERRMEWNERGLLATESYWDAGGGKAIRLDWNLHEIRISYDEAGNEIRRRLFGLRDEPVVDEDGVHEEEREWDERGHLVLERFFDVAGDPVIHGSLRCHERRSDYDRSGRLRAQRFYGPERKPLIRADGYFEMRQVYGDSGKVEQTAYFDARGEPVESQTLGAHRVEYRYRPDGKLISEAYFAADGQPVVRQSREQGKKEAFYWPHKREWDYGPNGEVSEIRSYSVSGELGVRREHGAIQRFEYDSFGNQTRIRHFDAQDRPYRPMRLGFAEMRRSCRPDGKLLTESYFDQQGEPMLYGGNYHLISYEYSEAGEVRAYAYFGTGGEPVIHPELGYHRFVKQLDPMGRAIGERYFGTDGQPVAGGGGAHEIRIERDVFGYFKSRKAFDIKGQPIRHSAWQAHELRQKNTPGNEMVWLEYRDIRGRPCLGSEGYFRLEKEYLRKGLPTLTRYLGTDGKPVAAGQYEAYGIRWQYDPHGEIERMSLIDATGKPMDGAGLGFAEIEYRRDAIRRLSEVIRWRADGSIHRHQRYHYPSERSLQVKAIKEVEE